MMRLANVPKMRSFVCAVVAALALGTVVTPVSASRLIQPQVTGQVTSVEGTAAVTVNGTTYLIAADSAAYQTVQGVHVGDTIGLVLNGPAGQSGTQVIYIVTNAGAASGASSSGSSSSSDTGSQ